MHVTIVEWSYDADLATETQLLDRYATTTGWCEALVAAGATRVSVVQRFHGEATVQRSGVEYRFCRDAGGPRSAWWRAVPRVALEVNALAPDVVHVNGLDAPVHTWMVRRRLAERSVLVVQDHASVPPDFPSSAWSAWARHLLWRRAMRAPDGFLFTALAQAEPWRASGLIGDDQPIHAVLEGSTRLQSLPQGEARRLTGITGTPALLWVGRLNANKDPLCVVEAFAEVRHSLPAATLTMIFGADDLRPAVETRLADRPTLRGAVRLLGVVPPGRMAPYYSAADLFVLGSHREGSGYALIEALGCGLAPVVTDIPSFRRITGDGRVGRLWPVGDAAACATAVVAMAREVGPGLRTAVRAHFDRSLSWRAIGGQAMAAYEAIARRGRGQRWGTSGGPSDPA